jgi:hypothetical protein
VDGGCSLSRRVWPAWMVAENRRKISHRRAERSVNIPLEVGCSPRLAGEARPDFRRGRNRREHNHAKPDQAAAGCTPAGSLVASGARRGEQPTEPNHPTTKPQPDNAPPSFPEPGPPEAPLTLTFSLYPTTNQHQEPTPRHTQADARVEDDRREDERENQLQQQGSYEVRHEAQRRAGNVGEPTATRKAPATSKPSERHRPRSMRIYGFEAEVAVYGKHARVAYGVVRVEYPQPRLGRQQFAH